MADARITPAYAGNTGGLHLLYSVHRDHPRLRGEHVANFYGDLGIWGSPPPTRGTLRKKISSSSERGITPAYAGNTYMVNAP